MAKQEVTYAGGGGGAGGGGLTLGPPQNQFTGANRAAAQSARDTYATANADWLAQYDAEPTFTIILTWGTTTIYEARRGGAWADVTGLVRGPAGAKGDPGTDGTVADGLQVDAAVFWSATTQHDEADLVRFGDSVTFTYGGTEVEASVYNVARDGHIVTLIVEPLGLDTWNAFQTAANVTVADSDGNQFGSWITASRQDDRADVQSAGQWFRAIAEAGAGSEVWREIDRIDEVDNTHLTVGTRTGTTLELRSSTGDDVLLPSATNSEAGLESAADKELLEALPPKWTVGTYSIGTERSWATRIYRCIADRTVADTGNPATDTTGWAQGATTAHTGTTNLSVGNRTGSSLDIRSDTGSAATVPSASQTEAGLQSAADKTKLDAVAAGAQVNVQADWNQGEATAGSYIKNKPTIPDVSNFRTHAQITAEITAALAGDGKIIDGGEWDGTQAYAERTLVYTTGPGAATYLSRVAVSANTAATSEPGVGSAWETSWLRIGYQDGPPNAFIDAAFTGRHLTLSREGGTNPQTLEVPIGTGQLVPQVVGTGGYTISTANRYVAEDAGDDPVDVSGIADTDMLAIRGEGADNDAELSLFLGADIQKNVSAGDTGTGRIIKTEVFGTARNLRLGADSDGHLLVSDDNVNADIATLTLWKFGGTNAPVGSTRVEQISFQASTGGNSTSDYEAEPLATDPISVSFGDGANQIITNVGGNDFDLAAGAYMLSAQIPLTDGTQNSKLDLVFRNASDNSNIDGARFTSTRPSSQTPRHCAVNGILHLSQAATVNIEVDRLGAASSVGAFSVQLARWGGGVTGFSPGRIGTATFPLDGTATDVALTDDTTSAPIVCPAAGWIIAVVTVPGLGLRGDVVWMLAEDLRDADADDQLTASLYTNARNEILFGASDQDGGATTGNRIILHHSGTVTESSGGAAPVVLPTILEFDVTGDATVTDADISNKRYSFVSRISQSAHVGSARIVGFLGTAANPSNVSRLAVIDDYYHDTGSFNLPASTTLAAVDDVYTIRLEVYPTGVPDTNAPTIYHDFRITRVAPTGQLHFGYVLGGADFAAAAALVDFANDIGDPRNTVAGDYTVSGIPDDSQVYRLYWAVPTTFTQPSGWTVASFPITNSLDTTGQLRTIAGIQYRIYVTEDDYDSTSNTVTTIAVTTG